MPKKKQPSEIPTVQVVFRVPQNLHDALQSAAAGLGLDLSNLLRMMIAEQVAEYIDRGRRAAAALVQARADVQPAPTATEQPDRGRREPAALGRQKRSIILDTAEPE